MQTALVIGLLLAFCGCLWVVAFVSLRLDRQKSFYFMFASLALSFYVIGYMGEVLATTREAAVTALRVENAGIPVLAPFFLLAMVSLFYPTLMRKWMMPAAFGYWIAMMLVAQTTDRHMLYYTSVALVEYAEGAYYVQLGRGPLYAVQQFVSMGCILTSYAVVLRRYITGTQKLRARMRVMIIGSVLSCAANVLNFSGLMPNGLDPAPFVMAVFMVLIAISLLQHRMMDLVPVASSSAVHSMEDALIVLDEQMALQYWNESAAKLFPSLENCIDGDPIARIMCWPDELRGEATPGEITFCRTDQHGADRYFRAKVGEVRDKRGLMMGWSYVCRDITENVDMMRQLEELATTDPLTGIYNRRQFMHMVNHEMEVAARLGLSTALIMYDLDHFKDVNDTFGHLAGDYVLCAIANIIRNQLRPYDIFARYGGEEFVIFTTSNEQVDLFAFADRLRERIETSEISYDGTSIPMTASFGVANIPPKAEFESAMRAVDIALYKAKYSGRNRVVVADEI